MDDKASIDVKEAVRKAKEYISELYHDEEIMHVGLEEVEFDYEDSKWNITIGFARAWDGAGGKDPITKEGKLSPRNFKVVRIDEGNGSVVSIRDRFMVDSRVG